MLLRWRTKLGNKFKKILNGMQQSKIKKKCSSLFVFCYFVFLSSSCPFHWFLRLFSHSSFSVTPLILSSLTHLLNILFRCFSLSLTMFHHKFTWYAIYKFAVFPREQKNILEIKYFCNFVGDEPAYFMHNALATFLGACIACWWFLLLYTTD
jgi:hypothetical protein